jgi:protoporphyrinogen oxidase
LRLNAKVTAITGQCGNFEIALSNSEKVTAEHVVLAICVQDNIRKLTIPGADLPWSSISSTTQTSTKGRKSSSSAHAMPD